MKCQIPTPEEVLNTENNFAKSGTTQQLNQDLKTNHQHHIIHVTVLKCT